MVRDRLLAGPAVADHGDAAAWDALGLLVAWLMRESVRSSLDVQAPRFAVGDIFNYWDQPEPPPDVAECMVSWQAAGLPVRTFDHAAAVDYLERHYGGEVLAAFHHAHHPSPQSDILRMARLLRDGGLYVDADDLFLGRGPIRHFERGAALMPLAVCRECPVSLVPQFEDPSAGLAWYYLGTSPWFARPGHPFVARCLERAVGAMSLRRARGERAQIHGDVGPGCVSMAALDYARACLRAGTDPDLSVRPGWSFVEQSRPLAYKDTDRNWRRDAVLYDTRREAV